MANRRAAAGPAETIDIDVPANPFMTFGLSMKIGPITAIQDHSPAAEAGLEPGDMIAEVDGQPVGDPLTLAGPPGGQSRPDRWFCRSFAKRPTGPCVRSKSRSRRASPTGGTIHFRSPSRFRKAPRLPGFAYRIENVIDAIAPGSPAETATLTGKDDAGGPRKLAPGMTIVQAEFILPPAEKKDGRLGGRGGTVEALPAEILQRKAELAGISLTRPGNAAGNPVQIDHRRRLDGRTRTGGGRRLVQSRPGSLLGCRNGRDSCAIVRPGDRDGRPRSARLGRPGLSLSEAFGDANLRARIGWTVRHRPASRAGRLARIAGIAVVPDHAQRESGGDQLPADSDPRRRPHGLSRCSKAF